MKKPTIIILVIIFIVILIGGTAFFIKKNKNDREKLKAPEIDNNPDGGLPRDFLAPTANTNPNNPATPTAGSPIISPKSAAGRAAISVKGEIIERTPETNGKVRRRYNLGENLFNGIPEAQAEAIKTSFANFVQGLDKNNYMEYPLYGTYTKPTLKAELIDFVKKYKTSGVRIDKGSIKLGSTKLGYLQSLGYNLVTGTDRPAIMTEADFNYFKRSNNLQSLEVAGTTVVKFAENWIAEIDRLNDSIETEAINLCLKNGWKFEGYTAPTTADL